MQFTQGFWPVSSRAILWLVNVKEKKTKQKKKKHFFLNRKDFLWVSANYWNIFKKNQL